MFPDFGCLTGGSKDSPLIEIPIDFTEKEELYEQADNSYKAVQGLRPLHQRMPPKGTLANGRTQRKGVQVRRGG